MSRLVLALATLMLSHPVLPATAQQKPQPRIMSGRLVDAAGTPIRGVRVDGLVAGRQVFTVQTSANGAFEVLIVDIDALQFGGGPIVRIDPYQPVQRARVGDFLLELSILTGQAAPPPAPGPPPAPAPPKTDSGPPASPGPRQSAWQFLGRGEQEQPGFGLYSYLLLTRAQPLPGDPQYDLNLAAIIELLRQMSTLDNMLLQRKPPELNVTYIPLQLLPPPGFVQPSGILSAYDYARATTLLGAIPDARRSGPYLVSAARPLGDGRVVPHPYLLQDLSGVPPRLASLWVRTFIDKTRGVDDWSRKNLQDYLVELRSEISRQADAFPQYRQALVGLITLSVR